jgi:hypothetical protein
MRGLLGIAGGIFGRLCLCLRLSMRRSMFLFLPPTAYRRTNQQHSENVTSTTPIPPPDWEALIGQIADEVIEEHTPARILLVRMKFYDLLSHCIPASMVLRTLTFKLVAKVDENLRSEIVKWSAFYEHRIKMGSVSSFFIFPPYDGNENDSPRGLC